MHSLVDVTMTTEHAAPYWVWGVETEDGVITVRAVAPTFDELLKTIGTAGPEIPLTDDCDGICDVFPATPELCDEIRKHGIGIACRLVERQGELVFDKTMSDSRN